MRTYNDFNNVTPTASNNLSIDFASADASGKAQDPKLVVTYEDPTEGPAGTYLTRNDDG